MCFEFWHHVATCDPDTAWEKRPKAGPFAEYYTPDGRATAAIFILAIGADRGVALRRRIWDRLDHQWVLSAGVLEASAATGPTLDECAESFPDLSLSTDAFMTRAQEDPTDGAIWVPFADLAELVREAGPWQWGYPGGPNRLK